MSSHVTTKTPKSGDQDTQKSNILVLSAVGRRVSPPPSSSLSSSKRLYLAVKTANAKASVSHILDILYEAIFGYTADELRIEMNIGANVSLLKTLKERNPLAYHYFQFAQMLVAIRLETDMAEKGPMILGRVDAIGYSVTDAVTYHYSIMTTWLKVDPITALPVDDEDVPF
jgi:hypothetical protein